MYTYIYIYIYIYVHTGVSRPYTPPGSSHSPMNADFSQARTLMITIMIVLLLVGDIVVTANYYY